MATDKKKRLIRTGQSYRKQETLDSLDIIMLPDYLTKTLDSAKIEPQQHYT